MLKMFKNYRSQQKAPSVMRRNFRFVEAWPAEGQEVGGQSWAWPGCRPLWVCGRLGGPALFAMRRTWVPKKSVSFSRCLLGCFYGFYAKRPS